MGKRLTILACLLLVMLFLIMNTPGVAAEPSHTHWIVTGDEVVENKTITLDGNLVVKAGGSLTMRNVTLEVNCQYDGQYKIEVKPKGSMFIYNSTISAVDSEHRFTFAVGGSAFEMKNSELHGVGWGPEEQLRDWDPKAIMSGNSGLLIDTDNAVIDGNTISNNYVGIILASSGVNLTNNTIHSNKVHGIYIYGGSDSRIANNYIEHSTVSSPIWIDYGHNNRIVDNTVVLSSIHRGVISTMGSHGNIFENNDISGLGVGIAMMFVSNNNIVRGNTISVDECGIMIWGWNNRVEGNTISDAVESPLTGVYMVYTYNTIVADNNISGVDGENGIMVRHSSNNIIINNRVSAWESAAEFCPSPSTGLLLFSSSKNNVIQGNLFSRFYRGMSLFYSSDRNTIAGNEVSSAQFQGIILDDSIENIIYGNNFVDIGQPPYDNGKNRWDYEGQGNYWSEYVAADADGDGIGDVPYVIGPEGADRFPLMEPIAIGSLTVPEPEPATPPDLGPLFGRTITGEEVIENQTIVLSCLGIENGASLTLRNVTLITGASSECSNLAVTPGGALFIYDCEIIHLEYGSGFQMQPAEGSTFVMKDSELHGCGHEWWYGGIQIYTDDAVIENNVITDTIISFFNCSSGRVAGNTISRSYLPVNLENSDNITIANNTMDGCIRTAIGGSGSGNTIRANSLSDIWENGIHVWGPDNLIEGNNISGVQKGFAAITLDGISDKAIGNTVSNSYIGLFMPGGANKSAVSNTISNCSRGLYIGGSSSHVEANTVSNCTFGICLDGSSNTVVSNMISNCDTGVKVAMCGYNVIYHNNFIDNTQQAEDRGSNRWDQDGQGNYWSDYQERYPDAWEHPEHKGIWDTPYAILGGDSRDLYPFMPPTPMIKTKQVTNVTLGSATLNLDFTVGDCDSVQVYFEYRKAGETDWASTKAATYHASGSHSDIISGLQRDTDYEFRAQLRYNNAAVSGEQHQFSTTFDTTAPTITITEIAEFVEELTSISGIASDNVALDKVQVLINNITDNTYWDGNSWVSRQTWVDATGTASWSFSMPILTEGKSYMVKAKAIDKAGNESLVATDSFTYKTAPAGAMDWWIWVIIGIITAGTIGGILYRRHRRSAA